MGIFFIWSTFIKTGKNATNKTVSKRGTYMGVLITRLKYTVQSRRKFDVIHSSIHSPSAKTFHCIIRNSGLSEQLSASSVGIKDLSNKPGKSLSCKPANLTASLRKDK